MKWFKPQTDENRSHERIMAILDSIDPVELFGTAQEPALASTAKPFTHYETRE